jgi:hypothetical protein
MAANLFLVFILALTVSQPTAAQENSAGIYLTIKPDKKYNNCPNKFSTRDNKTIVCATTKPIITAAEFSHLTEIKNDHAINFSYFNLVLSQQASDKVKNITASLADSEFVLVVDEKVVGFIKDKNQVVNRAIQLNGTANSEDVQWIHEQLTKIIKTKKTK